QSAKKPASSSSSDSSDDDKPVVVKPVVSKGKVFLFANVSIPMYSS
ncbi:unnamed protein product, partial [Rotaria magnacalcarata]